MIEVSNIRLPLDAGLPGGEREMRAFCDVYIESFEELLYPSDKRDLKRR